MLIKTVAFNYNMYYKMNLTHGESVIHQRDQFIMSQIKAFINIVY